MSAYSLDNKATKVAIVVNPPKGRETFDVETLDALDRWLEASCKKWAYIVHDLDVIEQDDGQVVQKTMHLHLFADMLVCQRLYTTMNKLADALGYANEQISIEKASEPVAVIQYLIHKNDPSKHQYPKGLIKTNIDEGELDAILSREVAPASLTFFVGVCSTCRNLVQVIERVGLETYNKWRNVILDIWHDVQKSRR